VGYNYGFELMTRADEVDAMLLALVERLCRKDAESLFAALPWTPEEDVQLVWGSGPPTRARRGIRGLGRETCVSMAFVPDSTLEAYDREEGPFEREDGAIVVGCVWLELHVGEHFAVLSATAATSAMSRAFLASGSVRRTWVELARAARAQALFFDTEESTWSCLHPKEGTFHRANRGSYASTDHRYLRVDEYAEDCLAALA
jgi:hypothetical protein